MFTYVKLKNYKSLVDFEVDLTSKKNTPKKFILIYGENGAGKTNLINAFFTLYELTTSRNKIEFLDEFLNKSKNKKNIDLDKKDAKNIIYEIIKNEFKQIDDMIEEYKTIDSKENMSLEFGFNLKGKIGKYYIELDSENIVEEKLDFTLNKKISTLFHLKKDKQESINKYIIKSKEYYTALLTEIKKFWGKHSLLSILLNEKMSKNKKYINENIDKGIFDVINFFISTNAYLKANSNFDRGKINRSKKILDNITSGSIEKKEEETLSYTENILDKLFTSLYSDIKKVFYKQETENDNRISYILFFKKNIYGKLIDISFDLESTGTRNIIKLLPFIINMLIPNTTSVLDEFDTGIHDLLVAKIMESLHFNIKSQVIMTTHNTTLLETSIKKDNIYIFSIDSCGKKILVPITDYERDHPNKNFRDKYLKGLYDGVPLIDNIDFDYILDKD